MSQPSLYLQVMGSQFHQLAAPVRRFHSLSGLHVLRGEVVIDAPKNRLARLLARCLGAPLADARGAIRFDLDASPALETWTRHFPGRTMTSRLARRDAELVERLGAARLTFRLAQAGGTLQMHLARLHFLGLPCPSWLMPRVIAQESGTDGRLHFAVQASVAGLGLVASYRGFLELPPEDCR